jgi:hypothetical protein
MEEFTIYAGADFVKIKLANVYGFPENTCHWGGYDVQAQIEIKSGNFNVKSSLWISTAEIYVFTQELKQCYNTLNGSANLNSYEGNLKVVGEFDGIGHVNFKGCFSEQNEWANELRFEFASDQTFIQLTLVELEQIVLKYGDTKGIKENSGNN